MSIPKVAQLGSALMQYANSANPTKSSSMMDFILNNNEVLVALASKLLFQPGTAYAVGDFIISDSMQNGLWAKCTTAGTTDTTEPTWGTKADDTVNSNSCIFTMVALATSSDLSKKVDKIDGKGLSTEDYTADEKIKLGGIAAKAEVNEISTVQVDGVDLAPDANKKVNVDLSKKANADTVYTKTETDDALKTKIDKTSFATDTEAVAGTATDKIVSPANLKAVTDSLDSSCFSIVDGALNIRFMKEV